MGRFFGRRIVQHHLQHAIAMAKERIWIEAAYFIPNRVLRGALKRAARRGVDVRVMVPEHSDIPGLADASRYTWTSLLKAGVRMFEWTRGCCTRRRSPSTASGARSGSYNLDARSLIYNWEVTLEVLDATAAGELEEKFREDLRFCRPVDPGAFRRRGLWDKVRERFFYFFRTWL